MKQKKSNRPDLTDMGCTFAPQVRRWCMHVHASPYPLLYVGVDAHHFRYATPSVVIAAFPSLCLTDL
jgi:hypothetical protein